MKIAFVLEESSLAGGHRNVYSLANCLQEREHEVVVFCVGPAYTNWMKVNVPVVSTGSYLGLDRALSEFDGIAIATWWKTAATVARNTEPGMGYYFIQDIETSYSHASDLAYQEQVLETYTYGLTHFTYGKWIEEEFKRQGLGEITRIGLGYDRELFYPAPERYEPNDVVLFHERNHFLKGPELRAEVLQKVAGKLNTTGYSPWRANPLAANHIWSCTDAELAGHMRGALALLVTSKHEGFCLPALEAMACGLPVVTTLADGNEEFCFDGKNCLVGADADTLVDKLLWLKDDPPLWHHIRSGGIETAKRYRWDYTVDKLESVLAVR